LLFQQISVVTAKKIWHLCQLTGYYVVFAQRVFVDFLSVMRRDMQRLDASIFRFDKMLRVVAGVATAMRANPAAKVDEGDLDIAERCRSAGLMRVNHVGEICAQALYEAQGRFAKSHGLRQQFAQAAREEEDHLAWTAQRLAELGSQPSVLNPLWYAGAYMLGVVAARLGDAQSLGFVVETERQVEAHLESHIQSLPVQDAKSRAIVEQMRIDEVEHGAAATALGAAAIPVPARQVMQAMAKVMTTTAYYL
jgi:ubiquinone biosynthesis monooxygenase Coq7